MNKWLVSMSAAAVAAGAMAVESQNIVGYQEISLDKQFTILGVNFTSVTNENSALSIQDAVPYVEGMTAANKFTDADQIQIQNAAGTYDTYYMSNGKNAKNATVAGLEHKWASGYNVATATLAPGTAFWFVRKDATNPLTIRIAGGVSKIASNSKGIDGTFKLIANPYPADLPLNDGIPYVAGMTAANKFTDADQIQIQNAAGTYDTYYMSNGKNAKGNTVAGLEHKWASGYNVADASIPAGAGAWFVRKGSTDFEITIVRPYSIE